MLLPHRYEDRINSVSLTEKPLSGVSAWEMKWLLDKAAKYAGSILEIGTYLGATAREFAVAFPNRQVISVDIHDPSYGLKREEVGSLAKEYPNTKLFIEDSKTFTIPEGVGVIFIDGDHTWEGVRADTEKALAYMRGRSGTIIWHDYWIECQVYPYLNWLIENGVSEIKTVQFTTLAFRDF